MLNLRYAMRNVFYLTLLSMIMTSVFVDRGVCQNPDRPAKDYVKVTSKTSQHPGANLCSIFATNTNTASRIEATIDINIALSNGKQSVSERVVPIPPGGTVPVQDVWLPPGTRIISVTVVGARYT